MYPFPSTSGMQFFDKQVSKISCWLFFACVLQEKKALISGCLFIDNTNVGLSGAAQGLVTSYQQALLSSAQACTYGTSNCSVVMLSY
jgi:hypothetical protein